MAHRVKPVAHRVKPVLLAPLTAPWAWVARCEECGPVGEYHRRDADGALTEAYARAKADARIHETYPTGTVLIVGGAEVHLR